MTSSDQENSEIKVKISKTRQKPYKCDHCDVSFKTKQNLNIHTSAFHEGKKPFGCTICDKKFAI